MSDYLDFIIVNKNCLLLKLYVESLHSGLYKWTSEIKDKGNPFCGKFRRFTTRKITVELLSTISQFISCDTEKGLAFLSYLKTAGKL